MKKRRIEESELVLNADNSLYHIHLRSEHIAPWVILVGDPGRVEMISNYFDEMEFKTQNREFVTHTGRIGEKRITVLSSGIGTDNIDIVVNELDAAVNVDPLTRTAKVKSRSLNLIRLGTTGALHEDLPVDSMILSEYGLGLDGLMYYYDFHMNVDEKNLQNAINDHIKWHPDLSTPYVVRASPELLQAFGSEMTGGITATATGFYGPQGRSIRLGLDREDLNDKLSSFRSENHRITNFEMETSALYMLGRALGHRCCTCCVVLANRVRREYSVNYKLAVQKMTELVLDRICNSELPE